MIYIKAEKPEDWKKLLADPEKHWRPKYSAHSLAYAWQNSIGFPKKVQTLFDKSEIKHLEDIEMILGIPEYKVSLPGGGRPSQNDLFVVARTKKDLVIIMVEGKVNESFGPYVEDWKNKKSDGKEKRLTFLTILLNLNLVNLTEIRYQLLHRTASAILTSKKFHCTTAVILVHSFSDSNQSFSDYEKFLSLYGLKAKIDCISDPVSLSGINTYWGWLKDKI